MVIEVVGVRVAVAVVTLFNESRSVLVTVEDGRTSTVEGLTVVDVAIVAFAVEAFTDAGETTDKGVTVAISTNLVSAVSFLALVEMADLFGGV